MWYSLTSTWLNQDTSSEISIPVSLKYRENTNHYTMTAKQRIHTVIPCVTAKQNQNKPLHLCSTRTQLKNFTRTPVTRLTSLCHCKTEKYQTITPCVIAKQKTHTNTPVTENNYNTNHNTSVKSWHNSHCKADIIHAAVADPGGPWRPGPLALRFLQNHAVFR